MLTSADWLGVLAPWLVEPLFAPETVKRLRRLAMTLPGECQGARTPSQSAEVSMGAASRLQPSLGGGPAVAAGGLVELVVRELPVELQQISDVPQGEAVSL